MLPQSLFVFLSTLSLAAAGPVVRRCKNATAVTPTLPVNPDAATPLPAPLGPFKHIVVGHGLQNYSCSAANTTATSAGALAVLYDIMSLYPGTSSKALSQADWTDLPRKVLYNTDIPLNLVGNAVNQYAADVKGPFKPENTPLKIGGNTMNVLGHHYFDAKLVPTFDLFGAKAFMKAKKLANIKAPTTADPGPLKTGAVDWLDLVQASDAVGIQQVYRVETNGGNPVACTSAGETFSVPYTAMYWFS